MYENRLDYLLEELFINPSDDNRLHKFLDPSNWEEATLETRTKFLKFFIDAAGMVFIGVSLKVGMTKSTLETLF